MGEAISTLVFRPPRPSPMSPTRFFTLRIDAAGNQIPAFFIKRRGARVTFLFSHGNAEDLGMTYHRMKEMARVFGVNVLAYDYTGYGVSSGPCHVPSEEMCYRNIDAVFRYLVEVRGIQPERIVLYGRSLGSGPTCYLAEKTAREGRSVAGVILHSPFLSIYRVAMDTGFSMTGDMFCNVDRAPHIRCPVLIIHGKQDEVVPFWHGQELLKSLAPTSRVRPFFIDGIGHNGIEFYHKHMYIASIVDFLCRYIPARSMGSPVSVAIVPLYEQPNVEEMIVTKSRVNAAWLGYGGKLLKRAMNCHNEACCRITDAQRKVDDNTVVVSSTKEKAENLRKSMGLAPDQGGHYSSNLRDSDDVRYPSVVGI